MFLTSKIASKFIELGSRKEGVVGREKRGPLQSFFQVALALRCPHLGASYGYMGECVKLLHTNHQIHTQKKMVCLQTNCLFMNNFKSSVCKLLI